MSKLSTLFLAVVMSAFAVLPARAQTPPAAVPPPAQGQPAPQLPAVAPAPRAATSSTVCGLSIPAPANLPPAGSAPVVYQVVPCFQKQGGTSVVEPYTYLYYIEMKNHVSVPSANRWVAYDDKIEQVVLGDFKRLWATNFLDDLAVDVQDYKFSNGVIGKLVVYDMEERQRVKIVDYVGSKKVEQSKIDEELKKKSLQIRLDSFIDQGLIRKVAGVVRDMYAEKGYEYAEVKPEIKPVSAATKTVNLSFHITEGPKVKIRVVDFQGNKAIADGKLGGKMKENKAPGMFRFITGAGTYKEGKFEEDADKVVQYYRERGYVKAQVGQPELKILEDSNDGKTRWVELQIPVTEGPRYKVGQISFTGNTVVKTAGLRPLFKMESGEWFNEKKIRKGFEKAREVYGSAGYFEFTGVPEYAFPNDPKGAATDGAADGDGTAGPPPPPSAVKAASVDDKTASVDGKAAADAKVAAAASAKAAATLKAIGDKPVVNIAMRLEEGKQYFVNRIIFLGNTTTRDNVIRREIRLYENGVFNTEALKYSVRRLNQLGYFKPLEGEAIDVQKTPNAEAQVDVRLKFEEQNRNQITFGAGVSQYEGFFGQLAFQTSNFLGRGETFSVSAQQGNRAKNYQVGFTEPFLFDRPITAGVDVFKQEIQYIGQFTQASSGMNTVWGFPAGAFSRFFVSYSYQRVQVKDLNPLYFTAASSNLTNNPFLADSLLLKEGGQRRISKIGPSYLFNTIDNPIFPTTGKKASLAVELAGLGGNSKFYTTKSEGIWYHALNRRTSFGMRAAFEFINPYGSTRDLPIFEKLFLGGEYSIRGFDIRSVGPRDLVSGIVIGGNKSLLFNGEYLINIAGPVRLVLFADAGQVRDRGDAFGWKEPVKRLTTIGALGPADAATALYAIGGFSSQLATRLDTLGETNAFKTSLGAEVRFFMPVLNVPFRLIFAANPSRGGVLDNNLRAEKLFKFRFAVGTTF
jgi:outer membrane protein insertion porin family